MFQLKIEIIIQLFILIILYNIIKMNTPYKINNRIIIENNNNIVQKNNEFIIKNKNYTILMHYNNNLISISFNMNYNDDHIIDHFNILKYNSKL